MRLVRQAWLLTRSELRQELRDRELLLTAGFFSLLMLAMFGLSFSALPRGDALRAAVPGMLWLSVAFVGSLTLTRIFDREREADTLRALLAAPVERLAVYLAKAVITLVVLVICCAVLIPGLMLLFEPARVMLEAPLQTAAIVVLGSLGFVAVGALFAAGLASGSGKNVLVAIILYPLTTPVLMIDMVATRALLERHEDVGAYIGQLLGLDLILLTVGAVLFESVVVGAGGRRGAARNARS
ncbi:MAG: heme exporter protein CcmB [Myxococcales bacterium]|nr:heme exporter protein CcmB [Myxococcales bacterium]